MDKLVGEKTKQAIGGFKIVGYSVKKSKDGEKVRLVLEAAVDDIACGDYNMGDVQGALLHHQVGDTEVGMSLFVDKK